MTDNRKFAERAVCLHQLETIEECRKLLDFEEMVSGFEALFAEHERAVRDECLDAANDVLGVYFDEFDGTAISNDMAKAMAK